MERFEIRFPAKTWRYATDHSITKPRVSIEAYNTLVDICSETGLPMSRIASTLILEAAKHVVYDRREE